MECYTPAFKHNKIPCLRDKSQTQCFNLEFGNRGSQTRVLDICSVSLTLVVYQAGVMIRFTAFAHVSFIIGGCH